jgi:hypothetical protein
MDHNRGLDVLPTVVYRPAADSIPVRQLAGTVAEPRSQLAH